jgi:hypothetical protein
MSDKDVTELLAVMSIEDRSAFFDTYRSSLIVTTFDVKCAVELTRVAEELVVKEHLFDHKSILPVKRESDHLTAIGGMVDHKTHIISNILVGGSASIINNILKDGVIVPVDHADRETTYRT